jgi:dephospho-CoA kinase
VVSRVAAAVGSAAVRVDHIGATAVPGLPAEDVVDLQLVVADLEVADGVGPALARAGFVRSPGQRWNLIPDGRRVEGRVHAACDPDRPVNVHVRAAGGSAWRRQLLLRDWLRAHDTERDAYGGLMLRLPSAGREACPEAKGPWIAAALVRAGQWARRSGWHPSGGPGSRGEAGFVREPPSETVGP